MATTLAHARAEARRRLQAGALRLYDAILAAVPADDDARLRVGDALAALGLRADAAAVYRALAAHDTRAGRPLPALVACAALESLGQPAGELRAAIVAGYASGSPQLGRFAARRAPAAPETVLEAPEAPDEPLAAVAARARAAALTATADDFPAQHPAIPFLSELTAEPLAALLGEVTVHRLAHGAPVVRQGEPGDALYLVASGELRVVVSPGGGEPREVARLGENAPFGEMALLGDQPRTASVEVVGEADLLEVSRAALARLVARLPAVKETLDQFARERLIKNLLATSPLFAPFSRPQQTELLRRFEGHEVEARTEVLREGERGPGLFLVLAGALEVSARGVSLARLGAGDIFGEMSLVNDTPTTATVRAATRATLLFLAREYVERLAAGIPEVRALFEDVALQRARDNTLRLARVGVPAEPMELDASDVILL